VKTVSEISRNLSANIQTRQITNAMYLLSVSEIRKLSGNITHIENYMHTLRLTIRDILSRSEDVMKAFRTRASSKAKKSAFLVISSDKSLCGAYNVNIVNLALEQIRSCENPIVFTAGKHGDSMLRAKGIEISKAYNLTTAGATIDSSGDIADDLIEGFIDGDFDEIYLCFTRYRNQAHQYASCIRLFPLEVEDFTDEITSSDTIDRVNKGDMIYEPSAEAVFEAICDEYVTGILYSAFCQSAMSEHIARMNSMQAATRNADKMIASLRLQYNTARQLAITNEIAEIAAANETFERGI